MKGTCQRVKEGSRCFYTTDCPSDMSCTMRGRCEKSVTGAPCYSDFWCPLDHACVFPTNSRMRTCQPGSNIGFESISSVGRGPSCNTEIDCVLNVNIIFRNFLCINKVCACRQLFLRNVRQATSVGLERYARTAPVWRPHWEGIVVHAYFLATVALDANTGLRRNAS